MNGPVKGAGVAYPSYKTGNRSTVYIVADSDHAHRLFQGEAMVNVRAACDEMCKRVDGAVIATLWADGKYNVRQANNCGDVEYRRFAKCIDVAVDGVADEEVGWERVNRIPIPVVKDTSCDEVVDFAAWIVKHVKGQDTAAAYRGGKVKTPIRLTLNERRALLTLWGQPRYVISTMNVGVGVFGDGFDHVKAVRGLESKHLVEHKSNGPYTVKPTYAGWERLRLLHAETADERAAVTRLMGEGTNS